MMNTMKMTFLALALSCMPAHAKTTMKIMGNDAGGGGNAVVCRNLQGQITSAETLDLFEARIIMGLTIQNSVEEPSRRAMMDGERITELNPTGFVNLALVVGGTAQMAKMLPPDIGLEPIDDSFPIVNKKGCKIEQLARYLESDQLLVDSEIWGALDSNSKAALYLHEGLYRYLRSESGSTNSKRARHILGLVMSTNEMPPPVLADNKGTYFCSAPAPGPTLQFVATQASIPNWFDLHFIRVNNQPLITDIHATSSDVFDPKAPYNFEELTAYGFGDYESDLSIRLTKLDSPSDGKLVFKATFEGAPGENKGEGSVDRIECQKY